MTAKDLLDNIIEFTGLVGGEMVTATVGGALASAGATLEDIVDWCVGEIDIITRTIANWRYQFSKKLAVWLDNDINFLVGVFALIVGSVAIVAAAVALDRVGFWSTVSAFFAEIKGKLANAAEVIQLRAVLAIQRVAVTLLPEYREQMVRIGNAFAALSEQLGIGTNFVNMCSLLISTTLNSTYQLLGFNTDARAILVMNEISNFTARLDAKFYEYYQNPGQILSDIEQEIILPNQKTTDPAVADFWTTVNNTAAVAQKTVEVIDELEKNIQNVIDATPDAVQEVLNERIQPIFDEYNGWRDNFINPAVDGVLQSINILENNGLITTEKVRDINFQMLFPADLLGQIFNLPDDVAKEQNTYIYNIVNHATDKLLEEDVDLTNQKLEAIMNGINQLYEGEIEEEVNEFTKETFQVQKYEPTLDRVSWFVGEY